MDEHNELDTNSSFLENDVGPVPNIQIPNLRTYKSDISQTVKKDGITTAKILMAEQRRQDIAREESTEASIKKPLNFFALFFGIVLVLGAIGIVGYFGYTKIVKKTFQAITIPPSFLFVFDQEKDIDSSLDNLDIFSSVEKDITDASQMKDETYTDLVFYKTDPTTHAQSRITSSEFFKIYGIQLPTNISRSISKDFVYGLYKTNGKVEPFLVVGLVDFETTYDSMFIWESSLALDIKDLFPVLKDLFDTSKEGTIINPKIENIATSTATSTKVATTTTPVATTTKITATSTKIIAITNATTTATTTPVQVLTPQQEFIRQNELRQNINKTVRFVDIVLYNHGVRGVRDANGNPFFYYTFLDRNKILFAQDPKVVNEINNKIKQVQLVR
jgi:hypothetical protein